MPLAIAVLSLLPAAPAVWPSSIDRSAPAMKSFLPEVTTTPLTAGSAIALSTAAANSGMELPDKTFIERSGMSQIRVTMPSESVSVRMFWVILRPPARDPERNDVRLTPRPLGGRGRGPRSGRVRVGNAGSAGMQRRGLRTYPHPARFRSPPSPAKRARVFSLQPLDDGGGAHAGADAEYGEAGFQVAPLHLVEQRAQDHGAGRT